MLHGPSIDLDANGRLPPPHPFPMPHPSSAGPILSPLDLPGHHHQRFPVPSPANPVPDTLFGSHGNPHLQHPHGVQHPPGPHPHLPPMPPEPPKPRFLFRMPRVVPNQKEKFESDELMKRHCREGEVRFTGFRDRPLMERQSKFIQSLREGHTEIVYFSSPMILNGVCIKWKGYMDMERLDGVGSIEFDEETAKVEDTILREQVEAYNKRMKDFEEHRKQQQRQLAAFMGQHQAAMAAMAAAANSGLPSTLSDRAKSTITTTSTTSFTEPKSLKIHSSNTSWKMENFQGADDKLEVLDEDDARSSQKLFKTEAPETSSLSSKAEAAS